MVVSELVFDHKVVAIDAGALEYVVADGDVRKHAESVIALCVAISEEYVGVEALANFAAHVKPQPLRQGAKDFVTQLAAKNLSFATQDDGRHISRKNPGVNYGRRRLYIPS